MVTHFLSNVERAILVMTEQRTICFYSVATHLGGAERSLLELVSGLKGHPKYRPWVLLPLPQGPLIDELNVAGIDFDTLPFAPGFLKLSRQKPLRAVLGGLLSIPGMVFYFFSLLTVLKKKKVHLIHTTGVKCHLLGAPAGLLLGIPVLWHLRDIFRRGPVHAFLRIQHVLCRVHVIANSKATAKAFSPTRHIAVIYNGLDPKIYFPKHNRELNRRFKIDNSISIVGLVGVFARWKGQVEFIKMAAELQKRGVHVHFVLVGKEIYDTHGEEGVTSELKRLIETLGMKEKISFAGFEKDVSKAINGLDVLVHASTKPEPFGRVIIEAFACQVPVVASMTGGILELVENEKTGLLFPSADVAKMADQIERVLKDRNLANQLSQNGYRKFLNELTNTQYVSEVIRIYNEILR